MSGRRKQIEIFQWLCLSRHSMEGGQHVIGRGCAKAKTCCAIPTRSNMSRLSRSYVKRNFLFRSSKLLHIFYSQDMELEFPFKSSKPLHIFNSPRISRLSRTLLHSDDLKYIMSIYIKI